jgi:outer membrane receptor for Fe3+-dicitrate
MRCFVFLSYTDDKQLIENYLEIFKRNNERNNLNTIIFINKGNIMQFIEGDSDKVNDLVLKIMFDSRHKSFIKIYDEYTDKEHLKDCSLKYVDLDKEKYHNLRFTNDAKLNSLFTLYKYANRME